MKAKPIKLLMMATVLFAMAFVAACSDDDGEDPADDRTALEAKIAEAEEIYANAVEGTVEDQYQAGSKATLLSAINAAQEVMDDESATQQEVNSATTNLQTALDEFDDKKVAPIAAENLVARWKFDEGEGTIIYDDSDNGHDGEFKNGPTDWGTGYPEWTTDRHGNANNALHFDEGANIEIPYHQALNPTTAISISAWVKTDVIKAGNRFIGLQSWVGYKFELQDLNHAFVSIGHEGGTYDKDGQVVIPNGEWHHIVATFGDGKTILYADGTATDVSTYNDTPNPATSIASNPYNLVIGQDFPTDKYASTTANFDNDKIIPLEWGGYFQGDLDEIRIYNVALTSQQVESIYNNEKPE